MDYMSSTVPNSGGLEYTGQSSRMPDSHSPEAQSPFLSSILIRKPPLYISPYPKLARLDNGKQAESRMDSAKQYPVQALSQCTDSWCDLKFERTPTVDSPVNVALTPGALDASHDPLAFGPDLDQWSFTKTSEYYGELHPDGISSSDPLQQEIESLTAVLLTRDSNYAPSKFARKPYLPPTMPDYRSWTPIRVLSAYDSLSQTPYTAGTEYAEAEVLNYRRSEEIWLEHLLRIRTLERCSTPLPPNHRFQASRQTEGQQVLNSVGCYSFLDDTGTDFTSFPSLAGGKIIHSGQLMESSNVHVPLHESPEPSPWLALSDTDPTSHPQQPMESFSSSPYQDESPSL
ncbi:MAG: hypothetical protein Q9181_001049, partial [Wetmoreana brouardii]